MDLTAGESSFVFVHKMLMNIFSSVGVPDYSSPFSRRNVILPCHQLFCPLCTCINC